MSEASAHTACIVSASSPSALFPYLGLGVCVQCKISGVIRDLGPGTDPRWQGTLNSCFESFPFFFFKKKNLELEGKRHTWREEIRRRETKVES